MGEGKGEVERGGGGRREGRRDGGEAARVHRYDKHLASYIRIYACTRLKCLCACSVYNYVQYMHILTQIGAYKRGVEVYMYST